MILACSSIAGGGAAFAEDVGYREIGGTYGANGVSGDGSVVIGNGGGGGFRWTAAGGIDYLGLGGTPVDVNFDGSVIVGVDSGQAFRWTASGVEYLGILPGGTSSFAHGVNADGSIVVGDTTFASAISARGFVWTSAGGMQELGTLGGDYSTAEDVNADGSVIVGQAGTVDDDYRAVRWVSGGGAEDLGALGGTWSAAYAVSDDGAVIVGSAEIGTRANHAFRWTAGRMTDIDGIATSSSQASDVSADGSVVVGYMNRGIAHAFRWTEATGMITVEDWLRASGVAVASDFARVARGVSADGNVVVGDTVNGTAFIARADASVGSGIIDLDQYAGTLAGKPGAQAGLGMAGTVLNGAHGEPMRNLLDAGRQSLSVTTDGGYDWGGGSDGGIGIADFGYGIGLDGGATLRLSAGGLRTRQDIDTGGRFRQDGFYVAPEASLPLSGPLYVTVGGYYGSGRLDVNRGYLNGGIMDFSRGKTDSESWGAKLRLDWLDAFSADSWAFPPYSSLTYAHARLDGYTEKGGAFPASFDAASDHATVARIGLDGVGEVADKVRLLGKVEAAYRFEDRTAGTSGEIVGLTGFSFDGRKTDQFWLRGGVGAEIDTGAGTAFASVNATTDGDDPTIWLRSGFKVTF